MVCGDKKRRSWSEIDKENFPKRSRKIRSRSLPESAPTESETVTQRKKMVRKSDHGVLSEHQGPVKRVPSHVEITDLVLEMEECYLTTSDGTSSGARLQSSVLRDPENAVGHIIDYLRR